MTKAHRLRRHLELFQVKVTSLLGRTSAFTPIGLTASLNSRTLFLLMIAMKLLQKICSSMYKIIHAYILGQNYQTQTRNHYPRNNQIRNSQDKQTYQNRIYRNVRCQDFQIHCKQPYREYLPNNTPNYPLAQENMSSNVSNILQHVNH